MKINGCITVFVFLLGALGVTLSVLLAIAEV